MPFAYIQLIGEQLGGSPPEMWPQPPLSIWGPGTPGIMPPIAPGGAPPTMWPSPPGMWPQPPHPGGGPMPQFPPYGSHQPVPLPPLPGVWPKPGVPTPPIYLPPVTAMPPIYIAEAPDNTLPQPPGTIWPPLPPELGLKGKVAIVVWVVGVGYRWFIYDTSLQPTPPMAPGGPVATPK